MITRDVERFIARRFAPSEREAALALVKAATIHDGSAASPRLIRCALVSRAGSLEKLQMEIEHLKIDYRDVIMSGEYDMRGGQARQGTKPQRAHRLSSCEPGRFSRSPA